MYWRVPNILVRYVLYNCTCSRPAMESATTEDTKEPQTDTLSLTASALANGYVKAKTCSSTSSDVYDSSLPLLPPA